MRTRKKRNPRQSPTPPGVCGVAENACSIRPSQNQSPRRHHSHPKLPPKRLPKNSRKRSGRGASICPPTRPRRRLSPSPSGKRASWPSCGASRPRRTALPSTCLRRRAKRTPPRCARRSSISPAWIWRSRKRCARPAVSAAHRPPRPTCRPRSSSAGTAGG